MKIRSILMAGLLVTSAAACKKKENKEEGGKVTEGSDKGTDKASGTEAGSDKGSATAPEGKKLTPEESVARYQECWGFFNDKKWDDFKGCFAADVTQKDLAMGTEAHGVDELIAHAKVFADAMPDMKGSPQIILVNGNRIFGAQLVTGTHTGALKSPMGEIPATNQKVGLLMAHGIEFGDDGKAKEEWFMMDMLSFMGQLGLLPKEVPFRAAVAEGAAQPEIVIAKMDDAEKALLESDKAEIEAFNAHNPDGIAAMYTEDMVWTDVAAPKDLDKKGFVEHTKAFMAGFSDLKLNAMEGWAAGAYSLFPAQLVGTNDKPLKEMMLDGSGKHFESTAIKVNHHKDGKVDHSWIFANGMAMVMQLHPEMAEKMMGGSKPAGGDKPADGAQPADGDKPAEGEKTE